MFRIPGNPQRQGDARKFTDDKIEISSKDIDFPKVLDPKLPHYKNDILPWKGK